MNRAGSGTPAPDIPDVHGYDLDPEDHRLLRSRPPDVVLRWVAEAVGPGTQVVGIRALAGGTSSAVHALAVTDARGNHADLVVRRFVRAGWLASEPDLAEHEARVLALLATSAVPAPRLVAVDPYAAVTDVPTVLMTKLPGRIDWSPGGAGAAPPRSPRDLGVFLHRLAEPLPVIHAVTVPADVAVRAYWPYYLGRRLRPPAGTTQPAAWERAIEVHAGPPPGRDRVFIHRDYHPGNILWQQGAVSGVVDWANASRGAPDADVGHCRVNLAGMFGQDVADRFLAAYQALSGRASYHPYWDIVAAVGGRGSSPSAPTDPAVDEFVARAVARLG